MSAIKNGQISLSCHFNKIIKGPCTDCRFHYLAMLIMTSQILKSVDFTKTQTSRYLKNETLVFLQMKKFINYTSTATSWRKIIWQRRQLLTDSSLQFYLIPEKSLKRSFTCQPDKNKVGKPSQTGWNVVLLTAATTYC